MTRAWLRQMPSEYHLGLILVTISAVGWSTAGFFSRLVPVDPWTMLFWRGVFGGLTALVYSTLRQSGRLRGAFSGMNRTDLLFMFLATTGMIAFVCSLKLTTVAHVSIIYAATPFATAGLAWIAIGERPSATTVIASLIAFCGVGLTAWGGLGEGDVRGDALALIMTVLMAGTIVLLRASRTTLPMVPAAGLSAVLGSLLSLPFAAPLAVTPEQLGNLALFGSTNMGIGFILFLIGGRHVPSAQTALITTLDTPLAPIWVWLAFGETPKATTVIAGAMVLAAVIWHLRFSSPRSPVVHTGPR